MPDDLDTAAHLGGRVLVVGAHRAGPRDEHAIADANGAAEADEGLERRPRRCAAALHPRQGIGSVAVIAALLLCAAPAQASRGCRVHGSKTLVATKTARAYQLHRKVYACLRASGERYRLGWNDRNGGFGGDYVDPLRLRGPFVGFARQEFDHYGKHK